MTQEEIATANADLNKFIGNERIAFNWKTPFNPAYWNQSTWNPDFSSNWNALMLVVEKIESFPGWVVSIEESYCKIAHLGTILCDIGGGNYTKRQATYEAATKFINYHKEYKNLFI